jgi:hypothetical protein
MMKALLGLVIVASMFFAVAAMAANTNIVTCSGGTVGFSDAVWNGSSWTGVSPTVDSLTVTAEVAIVGTYSLDNNKIDFAINELGTTEKGTIHGVFTVNSPIFYMYIAGIPASPCAMNVLSDGNIADNIPVTWSGDMNLAYNPGNNAVTSSTFPVGTTAFDLNCAITTAANQAAGNYVLDPVVQILPKM